MIYQSAEECVEGMRKEFREFSSRLTSVVIGVKMIMTTIMVSAWVAWIMLAIFTIPVPLLKHIEIWVFILYTIVLLAFWFTYSYARDGMLQIAINKEVDDIIKRHLDMWNEYKDMPAWMQEKVIKEDIKPMFDK